MPSSSSSVLSRAAVALLLLLTASAAAVVHDDENGTKPIHPHNKAMTTSRVLVHIPHDLFNVSGSGNEPHVVARFGNVEASGSINTFVYFVDDPLCHHAVNWTSNKTFPTRQQQQPSSSSYPTSPFILMARGSQGACTPVKQAREAQRSGAAALVITLETCLCYDMNCTTTFGAECSDNWPVLVNDGSAGDISIPVFVLAKPMSQAVIHKLMAAAAAQPVLMELTWGLKQGLVPITAAADDADDHAVTPPAPHQQPPRVNYQLWMAAAHHDPAIMDSDSFRNFKLMDAKFYQHAKFTPHFTLVNGARFGCNHQIQDGTGPCDHLCTNHGRYCAIGGKQNVTGRMMVHETLRRLCIWKHYGDNNGTTTIITPAAAAADGTSTTTGAAQQYWDYVIYHAENCNNNVASEHFNLTDCINKAYAAASHMDGAAIDACMTESGGVDGDGTNALLQLALEQEQHSGIVSLPAVTFDDTHVVLEEPTAQHLFEAICNHYWFHTTAHVEIPVMCAKCGSCPNVMGCLQHEGKCVEFSTSRSTHDHQDDDMMPAAGGGGSGGGAQQQPKKGRSFWKIFFFLVLLMAAGAGYYYYQQNYREGGGGGGGGGGLLNNYLQLSGDE